MSLRNRLWLVVGALVLLPLLIGGLVAVLLVSSAAENRVRGILGAEAGTVAALLASQCQQLGLAARSLGIEAALGDPARAAEAVAGTDYADYAAVLGGGGRIVAEAGDSPAGLEQLSTCTEPTAPGGYLAERVPIEVPALTAAVVTLAVDDELLDRLENTTPTELAVTLVKDGAVVASTAGRELSAALAEAVASSAGQPGFGAGGEVDGWLYEVGQPSSGSPFTVLVADPAPETGMLQQAFVIAVCLVAVLTLVLGWHLARQLAQPLAELTTAAERVAAGDLDQTLPVRRDDETGRLASSFNHMTRELRRNMNAVERSRDDMRRSLERLGGALGSTHDLDRLLEVVLEQAVATAGAHAGAAWASDGAGPLQLVVTKGSPAERPARIDAGGPADLRARAVATGELQRDGACVAIPLLRGERVVGLLELEGTPDGGPPDPSADDLLRALATQAGIAVDNVMLHREAERLSITDPLTGLWNFRYLSMSLAREIERATRFDRPLAVLMMDLDRFKEVNDTYGHARGDAVLQEVATRVAEQIREVDTLARYGGEEFVLILPETTLHGATRLAERICAGVRRSPFGAGGETPLRTTVSIGVAGFPQHGASAATLMRAADGALYVAKNAGRDRWHTAEA